MLQSVAEHFGFGFNPNHAWNGNRRERTPQRLPLQNLVRNRTKAEQTQSAATYLHATITFNAPQQLGSRPPQGVLYREAQLPDRLTGNQDIVVGQEAFDSMYRVKGFDEAAASSPHATARPGHPSNPSSRLQIFAACSSPTRRSRFDFPA